MDINIHTFYGTGIIVMLYQLLLGITARILSCDVLLATICDNLFYKYQVLYASITTLPTIYNHCYIGIFTKDLFSFQILSGRMSIETRRCIIHFHWSVQWEVERHPCRNV